MRKFPALVAVDCASAHNHGVAKTPWRQRIERAELLMRQHPSASEILSCYIPVARFQEALHEKLENMSDRQEQTSAGQAGPPELPLLISSFPEFLSVVERHAPQRLGEAARELHSQGEASWSQLLNNNWLSADASPVQPAQFLARAFLQPYAEWVRFRAAMNWQNYQDSLCPFCNRKPGVAVLRQLGEGARRSLLCSFCLAEWDFRRIVCPACGEKDNAKLPVYTAEEFDGIRVEACDTCKTYLKAIDLTRNGLAEPMIDELASPSLDLWARDHGYTKLELNLMGL